MSARWILPALFLMVPTSFLTAAESPKSMGFTFPDEWNDRAGTMMIFPSTYHYGR